MHGVLACRVGPVQGSCWRNAGMESNASTRTSADTHIMTRSFPYGQKVGISYVVADLRFPPYLLCYMEYNLLCSVICAFCHEWYLR